MSEQAKRPVYVSAGQMPRWQRSHVSKDFLRKLYNEGLLMRYSATPYDNQAVKRRNVEERYLLDYLRISMVPKNGKRNVRLDDDVFWDTSNMVILLRDLLPYYRQHDSARCLWLSKLLLEAVANAHAQHPGYSDMHGEEWDTIIGDLHQYYTEPTPPAP